MKNSVGTHAVCPYPWKLRFNHRRASALRAAWYKLRGRGGRWLARGWPELCVAICFSGVHAATVCGLYSNGRCCTLLFPRAFASIFAFTVRFDTTTNHRLESMLSNAPRCIERNRQRYERFLRLASDETFARTKLVNKCTRGWASRRKPVRLFCTICI